MSIAQIERKQSSKPATLPAIPALMTICKPALAHLHSETPLGTPLVLGITGVRRGDGRTTIALGLALAAAAHLDGEGKVLLVDGDVEKPTLHTRCNCPATPGLYEVATGEVELDQAIVEVHPGVWFLPAGNQPSNTTRYLKSLESDHILDKLGESFETVIIDLPPVHTPQSGVLPSQLVSRMVVVVKSGATSFSGLESVLALVPGEALSGIVLNAYRERIPRWLRKILG